MFSGLIAYSPLGVHLSADGFTGRLTGELVSANYTDVLGIEPIIGRGFLAMEDQVPGRYPVAMIQQSRFGRSGVHSSQEIVGEGPSE